MRREPSDRAEMVNQLLLDDTFVILNQQEKWSLIRCDWDDYEGWVDNKQWKPFPGGANLTGNLAVTMVMAIITFVITNFTGTREYWKEIFWPEVPVALKCPVPMMQLIEVLGLFTKPLALMIRLFANMMGGHMVVLVLMLLIFIFSAMFNYVVGGATAVFSLFFTVFMLALDTLVSFIQAYVFTILSTIFISMALVEPHEHEAK